MSPALDIAQLLEELGFDDADSARAAREALEAARLTNPRKHRIDAAKRPKIERVLEERFLVTCGAEDCARHLGERELVRTGDPSRCWSCHGSANRRAIDVAREAFRKAGIRKVVIVGGSPAVHDELRKAAPPDWDLRLVDGTGRRTLDLARADLRWADLVLVWGSSELDHKVSNLYVHQKEGSGSVVSVSRRGIAALLEEAVRHVRGGR